MTSLMNATAYTGQLTEGRDGMVWIDGGTFRMGSNHHYPEEAPERVVEVEGFWIDAHPITNDQFERFVNATGWVTVAERPAPAEQYPGASPGALRPGSLVFAPPPAGVRLHGLADWWCYTHGADWRRPYGPDSDLAGLGQHPVVHVAWEDVLAFAAWAGVELPSEAQWEYAARGGLEGATYAWGEALEPDGRHMANVWQGQFPFENLDEDGWARTSPVGTYAPNGYGLYDMIGNVWEWTKDWWSTGLSGQPQGGCCSAARNAEASSHDPAEGALRIPRKVLKGGSHLCAPNYCRRYRPAARHAHPVDTSTSHIGFRCVSRRPPPGLKSSI